MKAFLALFLFLSITTSVLAYDSCVTVDNELTPEEIARGQTSSQTEWCCETSGHVFCDNNNLDVCGFPGWCDNMKNPEKSCQPGSDFCCLDSGYIIDYSANVCCPPDNPFYLTIGSKAGRCGPYDDGGASDNYYTRNRDCEIIFNYDTNKFESPEEKCDNQIKYVCVDSNEKFLTKWIKDESWTYSACSDACSIGETKCVGLDYYGCGGLAETGLHVWLNYGHTAGKCGVECGSDTDCPDDVEVNSFCKDGKLNINFVDNFCDEFARCSKKAGTTILDLTIGKCQIECFTDEDCAEDIERERVCIGGKLIINTDIETCENYQCIPDRKTIISISEDGNVL